MEQKEFTNNLTGRRPGTVPSEESRMKAHASNPNKVTIITPHGTFLGIRAASRALNIEPPMISWYCAQGEWQRTNNKIKETSTGKPFTDYREWFKVTTVRKLSDGRRVHTPLGDFDTVTAAAGAHGITPAGICHKIKSPKKTDYYYLD